jgi:hypothetical protein
MEIYNTPRRLGKLFLFARVSVLAHQDILEVSNFTLRSDLGGSSRLAANYKKFPYGCGVGRAASYSMQRHSNSMPGLKFNGENENVKNI